MSTSPVHGKTHEFGMADRLRAAREDAGLTVRELEAMTGISRSSVGNYEAGRTRPRGPQLAAWALATGFDRTWLETGAIAPTPGDKWAHWESNPEPVGSLSSLVRAAA